DRVLDLFLLLAMPNRIGIIAVVQADDQPIVGGQEHPIGDDVRNRKDKIAQIVRAELGSALAIQDQQAAAVVVGVYEFRVGGDEAVGIGVAWQDAVAASDLPDCIARVAAEPSHAAAL